MKYRYYKGVEIELKLNKTLLSSWFLFSYRTQIYTTQQNIFYKYNIHIHHAQLKENITAVLTLT